MLDNHNNIMLTNAGGSLKMGKLNKNIYGFYSLFRRKREKVEAQNPYLPLTSGS